MKVSDEQEAEIERRLEEPSARIGRLRELHGAGNDYLRELELRFAALDLSGLARAARLRARRHLPRGARDLPPAGRGRGRDRGRARRAQHQRRRRLDATSPRSPSGSTATTWRSRSTATATACWRSTANGTVVDGDELMALAALHLRARRPARRRRRGGDGDDELRLPPRDGGRRHRGGHHERRRPLRAGRAGPARLGARRRAVGPHHRHRLRPSGDGIAAALLALEALDGADLAERHAMEKLPQRLVNVRVRDRDALDGAKSVWEAVERESEALEGRGRVLVRPSGHRAARARDGGGAGARTSARRSRAVWRIWSRQS